MQNRIWFTFQKEGIHRYPAAATNPELKDVSFLANPHRHVFHFKVEIEVFHDDRDLEFILAKRYCESLYTDKILEIDYMSCEMLARELHDKLTAKWPGRDMIITVSEDGENGATLEFKH